MGCTLIRTPKIVIAFFYVPMGRWASSVVKMAWFSTDAEPCTIIVIIIGPLIAGTGITIVSDCRFRWDDGRLCTRFSFEFIATPLSTPDCEYQFGLYPNSLGCSTTYTKCIYGQAHLAHCDAGLAYDAKSHNCVWPDQLLPHCNPEEIVGFKCPQKLSHRSPAAKFWPFPRFPVPGDCGRLITCVEGHPRLITCGDGKLFDSVSLSCLDPEELPHWYVELRELFKRSCFAKNVILCCSANKI